MNLNSPHRMSYSSSFDLDQAIASALQKIDANLVTFAEAYPHDTTLGNVYPPRKLGPYPEGSNVGWTTGFWPGMIWLAYERTGDSKYREAGELHVQRFAERMTRELDVDHHDLGFLYSLACVAPWRLTGNDLARQTVLQAADRLMTRYLDRPGILQAWGVMNDPDQRGRTIVDSLMNTPLLYWASQVSGNDRYHTAAYRHASQLQKHCVRPDGTTFHTFYFDPETGAPRFGKTAQGAGDDSCWARGQAWAMYGFALNYAGTRDGALLQTARRVSDYFLAHLPADKVAYWDLIYRDGSGEERDSSAAAIAVCGLMELSKWLPEGDGRTRYRDAATEILASLYENYSTRNVPESNALLLHGVYSKPGGVGVDEGTLWGDYFYLEALTRLAQPDWKPYW
jgi:unsaturated chondroitin disaccharide hydrolase